MIIMKCENDNNLKQLREIAGFTQEAAAEAIDVSPSTIQNWEYGQIPRDTNLLHDLLDLYRVDNLERAKVILSMYFPKDKLAKPELLQSIHDWDAAFSATPVPNRLYFFTDTLEMLDARIDSLTVTLDFANRIFSKKLYSIYNLKTAKTIDKTAAEYDLTLNAESAFKISAVNTEHVYYFPLWDFCKMPLEENGLTMSDADFLQQKTKDIIFSKASSKHTLQDGISLMKKDLDKLMQWRNTILLELSYSTHFTECVKTEYVIEKSGVLWQKVTILPCKKSYLLPPEENELSDIIVRSKSYPISFFEQEHLASSEHFLYCNSFYINKELVKQAIRTVLPLIHIGNVHFFTSREWEKICKSNKNLQDFCKEYSSERV